MSTANPYKLKIKDIITVVLLALINVVIFFASSVLYATPITIILMPVFFALLEGIVYFIIGTKVKKPGAIFIYSIVRAIMGGYLPYIILFILSGAIAELLLWKMGYGNAKALTVSYVINQVLAAFGSTIIPYAIAAKAMADQMVTDGRQDAILCRIPDAAVLGVCGAGGRCDRGGLYRRNDRQADREKAPCCVMQSKGVHHERN